MSLPNLPIEFGLSWQNFVNEWCLNVEIGYFPSEVIRALNALVRLWPASVSELTGRTQRGVATIVPAIELGDLLADCENTDGFTSVLERLKHGKESGAYSELVLMSSLSGLGYRSSFIAPIGGKNLDAVCYVDQQAIYFEVFAPERSDSFIETQKQIDDLNKRIKQANSACHIEVEIFDEMSRAKVEKLIETSREVTTGEWVMIESFARLRKITQGQKLPPLFDGDGAKMVFGGAHEIQNDSTVVITAWQESDNRAEGKFRKEYNHFSDHVANVLVGNVSAVADGISEWVSLIERRLQPSQYRNVGAVALFDQNLVINHPVAIRRRWRVIVNPHARIPVPKSLVEAIQSLDESRFYIPAQ